MNNIWKNIIKDLLTALYNIPDCGCGGCAHVVTDDMNVGDADIDFIVGYAEVLRNAIASDTVPLVSTFDQPLGAWNLTQPIGRAELEIRGDSIYAKLTFNEQSSDIYKDALDNGYNAKLGFHAVKCDVEDDIVNSMSIIACGVSDTCLGGVLEGIRNED